jgi:hypothetical protein
MTYAIGDRVLRNTATMGADQAAAHNRLYPGGHVGTVMFVEADATFTPAHQYKVNFADGWGWYGDADLLPAAVPEAQASLFGEGA